MPRADLVLEGGGVKGIALVGAVSVFEERGYEFGHVAGTSAGAIVASLIAAGYRGQALHDIVADTDYASFEDAEPWGRLQQALHLVVRSGLYSGDFARGFIADALARRQDGRSMTFADLLYTDPDGRVPAPGRESRLVVMASDVTAGRLRRFPWDFGEYGLDPGAASVADAVRASMPIPFFFRPVTLTTVPGGDEHLLVDGGMLSNFPIDVFDAPPGAAPRWPTFGVKLSARPPATDAADTDLLAADGPLTMARAMLSTMTGFYDRMHLDDPSVAVRTVFVDTTGIRSTDFHLTRAQADTLYAAGRTAAATFLDGGSGQPPWDFEAYKRRYRPVAAPPVVHTLPAPVSGRPDAPSVVSVAAR